MNTYVIAEKHFGTFTNPLRVRYAANDEIARSMAREIADRTSADVGLWNWTDGELRKICTIVLVRHPDGRRATEHEIEALIG